jgi:hypothetical protein
MITPNGRFKENTKLCLSMSDFHPELWNTQWSVSSIIVGLLSFMLETTPTTGSIETSNSVKRAYAAESLAFNCKNKIFCSLFPELVELHESLVTQVCIIVIAHIRILISNVLLHVCIIFYTTIT